MASGMVANTASATDLNDRELVRLSHSRPRPILAWLRHSTALQPLRIPILVIPLLLATLYAGMTTESAAWSLQWISVVSSSRLEGVVDPALRPGAVCPVQPPLYDWTIEGLVLATGLPADYLFIPLQVLTTFCLLWTVCNLARKFDGAAAGMIAAVLLALDTRLPGLVRHISTTPGALLLAVLAIRAMADHQRKDVTLASWHLLFSGCLLGLLALVNGAFAFVLIGIMAIVSFGNAAGRLIPRTGVVPAGQTRGAVLRQWVKQELLPILGSLFLWALTGFAVAGWWWLMMSRRQGVDVWAFDPWLANGLPMVDDVIWRNVVPPSDWVLGELGAVWLPASLLGLIGVWRSRPGQKLAVVTPILLVAWSVVGGGMWLWLRQEGLLSAMTADIWLLFARLPLLILAAIGLARACGREFPEFLTTATLNAIAALAVINALSLHARGYGHSFIEDGAGDHFGQVLLTAMVVAWLIGVIVRKSLAGLEPARCLVWNLTLGVALGASIWTMGQELALSPAQDWEWTQWRRQLDRIEVADRCILVSTPKGGSRVPEPPLELLAHLHARWPGIEVTRTQSWTTAATLVVREADAQTQPEILIVACGKDGLGQVPGTQLVLKSTGPNCYPPGWEVASFLVGGR